MVAETVLIMKGMAAGFTISMPVGPVALLCISRSLHKGRLSGFISGAGGATADTFYSLVAVFGLTIVINFIESNRTPIQIVAGILILFFGFLIFFTSPVRSYRNRGRVRKGIIGDYLSVLPLAFANPVSLFVYLGVFSGISLTYSDSPGIRALLLVPGVMLGALLWWLMLSGVVSRFRNSIRLRTLLWMNRIAGSLIIIFGFVLLIMLLITPKQ